MNGSDTVDVFFGLLPHRVARLVKQALLVAMLVTGCWLPLQWYMHEKQVSVTEQIQQLFHGLTASLRHQTYILEELHRPYPANALAPIAN
jgi:hypothetical protein